MTDPYHSPIAADGVRAEVDLPDDRAAPSRRGALRTAALATGSAALLLAMMTDALAVAGRHAGVTVLGAIEIVQVCVVVAATSAMVIATVDGGHARVRILLEQIGAGRARQFDRAADLCSASIFAVLVAGSAWLAADLWNGHEVTEVLGLPLRWARAFWIGGAALTAGIFALRAMRRRP